VLHQDRIVKLLSNKHKKLGTGKSDLTTSCKNSLKHSGVAGGKWGHAPQGAGFGGVSSHFCSHLKTRFKQKFRPKDA